ESIGAGPIAMRSSSRGGPADVFVTRIDASAIDTAAIRHVLDQAEYDSGGAGDLAWHRVLDRAAFKRVEVTTPDAKIALGDFSLDDVRARQPRHSFAPFLDRLMARGDMSEPRSSVKASVGGQGRPFEPDTADDAGEEAFNLLSSFSIARFGMSGP